MHSLHRSPRGRCADWRTHAHAQACTRELAQHALWHADAHASIRARTHIRTRKRTDIHTHTLKHTRTRTRTQTHLRTHTHAHTHARAHTHIRAHLLSLNQLVGLVVVDSGDYVIRIRASGGSPSPACAARIRRHSRRLRQGSCQRWRVECAEPLHALKHSHTRPPARTHAHAHTPSRTRSHCRFSSVP